MQHPDEGAIHAWIDGALTVEEAASLESHAAECDPCSEAIAEARGMVAASSRILLALDDVPSGVIPMPVPKPRSWYARNEFRAAAAILLVASASLVVVQGRQDVSPQMSDIASLSADTAAPITAPAPASAVASTAMPEAQTMTAAPAEAMRKSETDAMDAGGRSRSRTGESEIARREARVAGVSPVAAVPVARDRKTVTNEADFSGKGVSRGRAAGVDSGATRRIGSSRSQLDQAVVTGVASEDLRATSMNTVIAASPLKIVRADTLQRLRKTVYEVSKGVEVTLTQTEPMGFDEQTALRGGVAGGEVNAASAVSALPSIAAGTGSAKTVMRAPINTISWADSVTGRSYTLTGALPRGELEALKARIVAQRQPGFPPSRE